MINVPNTYAEWVDVIAILKSGTNDEDVINAMQQGTIAWQSGVAERFSQKLIDAINSRMNAASDKFQKNMNRANGEERAIVQALLGLRKEMGFLARAIDLPVLPEEHRAQYKDLVLEQADKMQSSLEDSAKRDRSGKLSSIVRNHKINTF